MGLPVVKVGVHYNGTSMSQATYTKHLSDVLKGINFSSVFELACGDGQNLKYIKELYPSVKIDGCDIEGKWGYPVCDILSMKTKKKYDIVLIAATLLILDDEQAGKVIALAKSMAKKFVIIIEPKKEGETVNEGDTGNPRYRRDYRRYGVTESFSFEGWPKVETKGAIMKIPI